MMRTVRKKMPINEGRYRLLFENSMDGILLTSPDGTIFDANPSACSILKRTREQIISSTRDDLINTSDPALARFIEERTRTGRAHGELEARHPDGTIFPVEVSSVVFPSSEGQAHTCILLRDISGRKHAETEREQNQREREQLLVKQAAMEARVRLAAIVESSDDAIIGTDIDGIITDWNKGAERLYGYAANKVIGKPVSLLIPRNGLAEFAEIMGKIRNGISVNHFETTRQKKDGKRIQVSSRVSPIVDREGRVVGVSAISRDISELKRQEAALRESEQRFRLVADTAPVLIWMSGTEKLCTYFNEPWLEFTGRPIDSELGNGWAEGVHPEDLQRCLDTYTQSFDRREKFRMEYRLRHRDGEYRWLLDAGVPRFNKDGSFAGYIGICVDVNERKLVEQERLISEHRFRQFFETMPEYCYMVSPNGEIIDTNLALCCLGYTKRELVGKPLSTLYAPECAPKMQTLFEKWKTEGAVRNEEMIVITKWGERRTVLLNAGCVRDSNGSILHSTSIQVDITERRRAEEALRRSEARLRLAAEVGRMYAYEWDVATDTIMRSPEYVTILGFGDPAEQLTRQQILDRVHPDDQALLIESVGQPSPANPTTQTRYRMLRPDGSVIWLESNGRAFFDAQGRLVRMIGMVADITQRKRAEEALASVSRKLIEAQEQERTRIGRDLHDDIVQRLALLAIDLEGVQHDSVPELSGRIDDLRKQAMQIANDVQSLSHELHSSKLEYLGIVGAIKNFCREYGERQRLEIDFESHDLPAALPAELSLSLFRVLQEALRNATKHSGVKSFEVRLWGTPDEIHLTVRDSGVGFHPEAARGGRGLGLVSMEERLKLLNGTLAIESERKRGTTIHARVPVRSEQILQSATA